jgi:hypothetical protein
MKEHVSISVPYATPYFPITHQRKGPDVLIIFLMAPQLSMFSAVFYFWWDHKLSMMQEKKYRSEDIPSQIGKRFSFMQSTP